MATIQSSSEHLTLNADGAGKDIKFQANGVEKASIDSSGNFTSTSIDATKLSGALPAIDGSDLTGVGKVLQVVQGTYSTEVNTTSSTYTDTGLSASITPSSTSSKILVLVDQPTWVERSGGESVSARAKLLRDTTSIVEHFGALHLEAGLNNEIDRSITTSITFNYLDSPASTSAITYKTQVACEQTTASPQTRSQKNSQQSTITLMEIGA